MFGINHIHPLVVHFPIALIVTGFFLDVMSLFFNKKEPCLSRAGLYLMILGTLAAFAAYFSGEFFTDDYKDRAGELKEIHEIFAKTTMFVMLAGSALRVWLIIRKKENSSWKWVVFILFLAGVIFVGVTGFYGGTLVYDCIINGSC